MLILGIETTCDETSCSVVKDGREILSNIIASQEEIHRPFGGVVPELACRRHVDVCLPVLEKALAEANLSLEEIDVIAVANGPGLVGALLIGTHFAKGLGIASGKPVIGVNHIEAHLYSAMMERLPPFPALGVVVSGGHTSLVLIEKVGHYQLIGQTQDDAIGEAFDKVAKLLNLPYPGGPEVEKLARKGNHDRFNFTAGRVKQRPFDFSFSGLKTAVLYTLRDRKEWSEKDHCDLAASFQKTAFEDLVKKSLKAAAEYGCQSLVVGGGVSQNNYFRNALESAASLPVFWPQKGLSTDNAAMIAGLGYHIYCQKREDSLQFEVQTKMPFESVCSST